MAAKNRGLTISDTLALPLSAVTQTFAVLGQKGSGKTSTAVVLTEELIGAGQPVCVLDPVGVWWGLRSSADGTGPGLPVTILGGDHGDLELPHDAGERVADLLVEERLPLVLDLSDMRKGKQRGFVAEFLETVYRRNRRPLHVVMDEADAFAPQRATGDAFRCLGASEDICRRGRAKGIGLTSITQRPAVLHKDILSQTSVLVAMRVTGVHDSKAIDEWVRLHADDTQARKMKESLPSLPTGTAWVWSPEWLGAFEQAAIRPRWTFDSSRTPSPDDEVQAPTAFATVDAADLERLGKRLTPPGEAKPAKGGTSGGEVTKLRRELTAVRRELEDERNREPERVEVPALSADDVAAIGVAVDALRDVATKLAAALPARPAPAEPQHRAQRAERPSHTQAAQRPSAAGGDGKPLKAGARKMLDVLVRQYPMRLTRPQLGALAKVKHTGGTFSSYLSALRSAGLIIERDGYLQPSDAGFAAAGVQPSSPMTTDEVLEQWRSVLKAGARTMLDELVAAHPHGLTRPELADAAGLEITGGTFAAYLSSLRTNALVAEQNGQVFAADLFFSGKGS